MNNTIHILFELLIEKMKLDIEGKQYHLVFIRKGENKETAVSRYCKERGINKKDNFAFASVDDISN